MKLKELLATLSDMSGLPEHPALDQEVTGLCTNSHACKPGSLFIGMPGTRVDGGEFWVSAVESGAIAALVSPSALQNKPPSSSEFPNALVIAVPDMAIACAAVSAAFYDYPSRKMQLVGVTGTNGKTTTTHLIEFFLQQAQKPVALLGTLYARWPGYQKTAVHTTPFALELQEQLSEAAQAGSQMAVMEVSSHALAQGRVSDCTFEVGVFTNLTQDHLDYHKDLEDYFQAKALLFSPQYLAGRAIINLDDAYGKRIASSLEVGRVWTYSTQDSTADLWTSDLVYEPDGVSGILHTPVGNASFKSPLVGQFNLANLLAAVGAALHLGVDVETIVAALPRFSGVPGRVEQVQVQPNQDISVIVDYAHTPDSLENLLKASRPFIKGRMICVFGCGGDRDRTKRPQMGSIAARLSDWAIVTSDNPRTEDPQRILDDIVAGIPEGTNPLVLGDRAQAIRTAILEAKPGDGVLIAGKGHEDYQILGTEKVHFDDREQARVALEERFAVTA
ncbi:MULTISPECIES: UDP-N-acetylmuramoyl-L-alanyl-D-glutamate--2,6-diaminopimelate ligase [unclassified Leptolyngbya]|uniref:UDP-N-acetylmuramoyl-L-alanyl-D-glutamate--2, 6-diaminopimelate ligase n=1 Tax=unclassified Leptolyngbya TaxID=2650499 RepID=UPI0016894E6F|nr:MULTISPECIES: UDP-N-acetylmuramoyl-L-alanyl-D-glutamate--2,6-diaminopimelate ligase [unclassified Leptolyngbya]MBD1910212.1 UDP-N-acetylmuramoyl-L-alanyl-D-glutamate--2,6-diaminopimelate ligase [Leptolyngbya sp. FACHB-8]MBD2153400.1 UDP-N-acetylmuramoyl-L-alanyl-D-glutamate--2,6-diaminopimelate ligase [Leptolyngbya sp. FACHB-16]